MSQIDSILRSAHTIAGVGLSGKRYRPSYGVSEYMQRAGYRIVPVNPLESEILGEKCYPDLDSVPGEIDIVDIFRRSEMVAPVVESAIRIGAAAVWMQEGVEDPSSARKARPCSYPPLCAARSISASCSIAPTASFSLWSAS